MLERIPGKEKVQILQGTLEFGKDIVFWDTGPLGETMACACVVKNTRITGTVDRPRGARTVFNQIDQALDTPFLDANANEVNVSRVYVMSPGVVSQNAIMSIKGKLRQRSGQVEFVCGRALFALFRKYWPDYFADETAIIDRHLQALNSQLDRANAMPSVAYESGLGQISDSERRIYVQPSFFRHVNYYDLDMSFSDTLLGGKALDDDWTKDDFTILDHDHIKLLALVDRCKEFGLCEFAISHKKKLKRDLRSLRDRLYDLWEESLSRSLNQPYLENGDVTSRSKCDIIGANDQIDVEQDINVLTESILSLLQPLVALRLSMPEESVVSATPSILRSVEFGNASVVSDCCLLSSGSSLIYTGTVRYSFGKQLLSDWDGSLLISGGPGSGKTAFCRWNALRDAELYNTGHSCRFPVYVPLHRVEPHDNSSLSDLVLRYIRTSTLIDGAEFELGGNNPVRVYLDGLDEIPNLRWRQKLMELARTAVEKFDNLSVVVTVRDSITEPWFSWLPRVHISGLDDREILELVGKWLDNDPNDVRAFQQDLEASDSLRQLMTTPLLATLIILVYRKKRRLPQNRGQLYNMFAELLCGGWDLAKGVLRASRFSADVKLTVLTELAHKLHVKGKRPFTKQQLAAVVNKTLPRLRANTTALLDELLVDGLLIREAQTLQFRHHSFQEYFTARALVHALKPIGVKRALLEFLKGNDWWNEVVKLYIELCEQPKDLARFLYDEQDLAGFYGQENGHHTELLRMISKIYPDAEIESDVTYAAERIPRKP